MSSLLDRSLGAPASLPAFRCFARCSHFPINSPSGKMPAIPGVRHRCPERGSSGTLPLKSAGRRGRLRYRKRIQFQSDASATARAGKVSSPPATVLPVAALILCQAVIGGDGLDHWHVRYSAPEGIYFGSVAAGQDRLVAVGRNGRIVTSTDPSSGRWPILEQRSALKTLPQAMEPLSPRPYRTRSSDQPMD